MNKIKRAKTIRENYGKYHIPSMPNYYKRPKNAVFISPANSLEHEIKKLEVCYELRTLKIPFITEAVRNKKDEKGKHRRVDIVNLVTCQEIEIETTKRRAARFKGEKNVQVVMVK